MIYLIMACSGPTEPGPDPGVDDSVAQVVDSDDSAVDTGTLGFCGPVTEPAAEGSVPAVRVVADLTWTLEYDEDAEAQGFYDCSYARVFEGLEVLDQPYLCGDCDHIAAGDATMAEGDEDCFAQISSGEPSRPEWWGVDVDGMRLFRSATANILGEMDVNVSSDWSDGDADVGWASTYDVDGGGTVQLTALGTLTWEEDEAVLLPDYWAPRQTDYAGSWPRDDPGTLELDYSLEAYGDVFPNVRLMDQCEDQVALWDLYGRWLVIDTSQYNCGPCQTMAKTFPELQDALEAEGVEVMMVTFFGNGLSDPLGTPDKSLVDAWVEEYGNHGPLYYDRGFGYAIFPDFLRTATGEDFGYPAWVLVNPQMEIVHGSVGFGSWDEAAGIIREAEGL
jgi:thiol-disulfide isomerase/thioredoxin